MKAKIYSSRGMTMQSQQRHAPHCFNLLRQSRVLAKCGKGDVQKHFDAWESETSLCRAFAIGKTEANAATR